MVEFLCGTIIDIWVWKDCLFKNTYSNIEDDTIIRPFLDARDDILNAQNQILLEEQIK